MVAKPPDESFCCIERSVMLRAGIIGATGYTGDRTGTNYTTAIPRRAGRLADQRKLAAASN